MSLDSKKWKEYKSPCEKNQNFIVVKQENFYHIVDVDLQMLRVFIGVNKISCKLRRVSSKLETAIIFASYNSYRGHVEA